MSKKWDDFIEEKPSSDLEHKTMARARQELDAIQSSSSIYKFLIPAIPGLALLTFLFNRAKLDSSDEKNSIANRTEESEEFMAELADLSLEELKELDEELIVELDLLEDLELLEGWDGKEDV